MAPPDGEGAPGQDQPGPVINERRSAGHRHGVARRVVVAGMPNISKDLARVFVPDLEAAIRPYIRIPTSATMTEFSPTMGTGSRPALSDVPWMVTTAKPWRVAATPKYSPSQ